jgi:restriction endonuclease S subunit
MKDAPMPNDQRNEGQSNRPTARLGNVVESLFIGIVIARQQKIGLGEVALQVASVKDIENGILNQRNSLQELVLPEDSQVDRFRLRLGDVLVAARGSMKVALVGSEHEGCLAGPNVIVVRPGSNLESALVLAFLRHPLTQANIYRKSLTTTVSSINVKTIFDLEIVVPPKQNQIQLSRVVELAEKQYVLAQRASDLRRQLGQELAMRALMA